MLKEKQNFSIKEVLDKATILNHYFCLNNIIILNALMYM